jgi:hypothetical protein
LHEAPQKLNQLKNSGLLTKAEVYQQKAKLLSKQLGRTIFPAGGEGLAGRRQWGYLAVCGMIMRLTP